MRTALRYLPRQLADYFLTRGAAMVVVGLVLMLPVLVTELQPDGSYASLLVQLLFNASPFLVLVGCYGLAGQDFRMGYYRLLFARPLSPVIYYAQAFLVAWVGVLCATLVLVGLFALFVAPAWPGTALLDVSVRFLALGSIIFALSRITRLDWLFALFVFILSDVLRTRLPADDSVLGAVLNVVLPPDVPDHLFYGVASVPWGDVLWATGYAVGVLVLGLVLIRTVPFGSVR